MRPNGFRLNFAQNSQGNPPKMNPNPARKRAEFFRRGGGSKSEARNLLCPKIQKEFLFENIFCYTRNVESIISKVGRNGYSSFLTLR